MMNYLSFIYKAPAPAYELIEAEAYRPDRAVLVSAERLKELHEELNQPVAKNVALERLFAQGFKYVQH